MKQVYELKATIAERNQKGKEAEMNEDTGSAIEFYEQNIKEGYPDAFAFERLMILYRKEKKYKDELRVINKGIKVFTDHYGRHQKELLSEAKNKKQVMELSKALMQKSGLSDKRGNETYLPAPLDKWTKRKAVVEKKLSPV